MNEQIGSLVSWISQIETKVQTLNDRTKRQTLQIRELNHKVKELETFINKECV